jgi:DNA modification methylase
MEGTVGLDCALAWSSFRSFKRSRHANALAVFVWMIDMATKRQLEHDQDFKRQKLVKTAGRRRKLEAGREMSERADSNRRNDLLPELRLRQVALSELSPSPHRSRQLKADHVERLVASISDLGFALPILVRESEIVDGHVRVAAAERIGMVSVPAIEISHLSSAEVRKLRLTLNRTAEMGEWDLDQLRVEISDLIDLDVELSSTGFSVQDLDIILLDEDDEGSEEASDQLPDAAGPPVTRPGDLWLLGDHRIICGNSLDADIHDTLLDGRAVHLVLTDPPYNVSIPGNVSGLGKNKHADFAMASGEMGHPEWQAFLDKVLTQLAAPLIEGGIIFVFMDWRSIHRVYGAGFAAGLNLVNLIVWYKEAGAMGALYRSAHELIATFCKGKAARTNNVELGRHGRNRTNVWVAPGANRHGSSANEMLAFHATPKPVELCVDAILDVSKRGDTVLDIFLGSGTTLIAAEKTGRACCGIEIEPRFVDVAIRRWEQLTGGEAILAGTGETLAQVGKIREQEAADQQSEAGHD